jgi:hypothetical protein
MDLTDILLRLVGAFYAFAGVVGSRVALTSHFLDRAISAIGGKPTPRAETLQFYWLLGSALLVLAGGAALMLRIDVAAWVFLASALGQAAYILVLAPRFFDLHDPPDARGRRQTVNAFIVYSAATAFVLWALAAGRLMPWRELPWPLAAVAAAAVIGWLAYVGHLLNGKPRPDTPLAGFAKMGDGDPPPDPTLARRIKVMADYDCHPLWALDDGLYGDIAPADMGLSAELVRDLDAWAEAYTSSLDRDNPAVSRWSDAQHRAHAADGRLLAVRLARERPDLEVYVLDGESGVVPVHPDESV